MKSDNLYFIIDFDSTFIKIESLEKLAEIALEKNPRREKILKKMRKITQKGMTGKIAYDVSLNERIKLFNANKNHIEKLIKILKKNITPSIIRNKEFFTKYKESIYIISGGFKEYISPLFKSFDIKSTHILANEFIFDKKGNIAGFNKKNFLTKSGGKIKQIKALNLKGKVYVVGDGYTDYEIKKSGLAEKFFVFCENVKRDNIAKKADYILPNFDEFLYIMGMPRAYSYPKNRIKILLLENMHKVAMDSFQNEGYQVESLSRSMDEDELIKVVKDVHVIGSASRTQITQKIVKNAPRLLCVARFGIGTNNIDLKSCANNGVVVFNAPYSNARSVVELVLGEIIMLSRRVFDKNIKAHAGTWEKTSTNTHEVKGKKLGIIGYGNIGSQVSFLAEMLGMEVYYYDVVEKLPLGKAQPCRSMEEVFKVADIVTLHMDGRKENTNLIGEKEFAQMKNGVLFINTSRGYIVDIQALAKNIKKGKILGAAIDVYPQEPKSNEEKLVSPLQNLPNVILTPHIAGRSEEAQMHMGYFVPQRVINFINTGSTVLSVNFPNLQLPELKNAHRLIHIHKNVPGVMAKINSLFAEHKINIEGQYLKTNEDIGYVITDVNKRYDEQVIRILKQMPETIKLRILY